MARSFRNTRPYDSFAFSGSPIRARPESESDLTHLKGQKLNLSPCNEGELKSDQYPHWGAREFPGPVFLVSPLVLARAFICLDAKRNLDHKLDAWVHASNCGIGCTGGRFWAWWRLRASWSEELPLAFLRSANSVSRSLARWTSRSRFILIRSSLLS